MSEEKTITIREMIDLLKEKEIKAGGDMEVVVSIPFRDGIGLHYERIKNISIAGGVCDIAVTMPTADDVEKPHS